MVGSYQALDSTFSWPSVMVAPDGTVWAIYVDAHHLECSTDITGSTTCDPDSNRIMLYQSTASTSSRYLLSPAPNNSLTCRHPISASELRGQE